MKKLIALVVFFSFSFYAEGSTKMNDGSSQGLGNRLRIIISDPLMQVLGLEVADLTEQEKKRFGMQEGIKVTHITQAKKNDGKSIRKDFI